jgi:arsenate-mycothiol transferase
LFICVKNAGKSQMAAGLISKIGGDTVEVYSAGTNPGAEINALSAEALREAGVDITANTPKPIDPQLIREVDVVVTLGSDARAPSDPGSRLENWDTDEPSERGIDGIERMRLVRDDIAARVNDLAARLRSKPLQFG